MTEHRRLYSGYDEIGEEYYDKGRHPTCANFAELSQLYLTPLIARYAKFGTQILEVGAGRSCVAPVLETMNVPLTELTLLDQSSRMLEYSAPWQKQGARLIVSDVCTSELPASAYQLIVSSLGDPYNGLGFWREVERLLSHDGRCLFTTPAFEWSNRFRTPSERGAAEFLLENGETVFVRSKIFSVPDQIDMCEQLGLEVEGTRQFSASDLVGARSPKVVFKNCADEIALVRGYTFRKL